MSTVNREEVLKFEAIANDWWSLSGPASGLHSMNSLRVPLVTDGLAKLGRTKACDTPLQGLKIADVGCGGGILSEALARLGASVTGLDPCEANIKIAQSHASLDPSILDRIKYMPMSAEDFLANHIKEPFDAVVSSEVIEHVEDPATFVSICSQLIAPGGSLFFTTINRSTRSWLGAIIAAEYVLRLLPTGTHDWDKFIKPEELIKMVEDANCHVRLVHGMFYIPGVNKWTWFPDTSVNYALHAVKL